MRDHERELIAALAEGSLDDESEARALLESSEEAREEYAAQLGAIEALGAIGPAEMTELERAALRRDTWTALRSDPSPTSARAPWYHRLAYAAGALVLVVGLAAVLTRGGGDSQMMTATGDESAATTQADAMARDGDDDDAESAEETEATTAAADTAAAPASAFFTETAQAVRSGEDPDRSSGLGSSEAGDAEACLEQAGLDDHDPVWVVTDQDDVEYLVAVPAGVETGPETPVAFVVRATCELTHTEP